MNRIGRRILIAMGVILVVAAIASAIAYSRKCTGEKSVAIGDVMLLAGCR